MADHVRKQCRDAAVVALTGLVTSGVRVYPSRTHELQDTDLPGLRIYTNEEGIETLSLGLNRRRDHRLTLVVECCSKKSTGMDAQLDSMIKEVMVALDSNQGIGGAKFVEPRGIEIDMEGEAEKEVGVARIRFEVFFATAQGAPDVAL